MSAVDECRSNYYTDTGRRQDLGDREVRCTLPAGHDGDHEEWFDDAGGLLAAWKPLPPAPPRTWSLPPEPGPEVQAVRDEMGALWQRYDDNAWRHLAARRTWGSLLADFGPLTDATGGLS